VSDSKDLLGKADAFLKRYRPSSKSAPDDVPVLTEVVAEPTTQSSASVGAAGNLAKPNLQELEQRLRQSLLDAIGPFVANFLEERLRAHLDAHLQRVLPTLADQIKTDVEILVSDAVTRAVEKEIARSR
jgi:hypothetical protein